MLRRNFTLAGVCLISGAITPLAATGAAAHRSGIVSTKSDFSIAETVERIKRDLETKGIKLFSVIDQAALAKEVGIDIRPSTLIVFGNPALGTQFLSANPQSGLDWPVRLLVYQDDAGQVWTAYNDFHWIARRHGIKSRNAQFTMASAVIKSIVASTISVPL